MPSECAVQQRLRPTLSNVLRQPRDTASRPVQCERSIPARVAGMRERSHAPVAGRSGGRVWHEGSIGEAIRVWYTRQKSLGACGPGLVVDEPFLAGSLLASASGLLVDEPLLAGSLLASASGLFVDESLLAGSLLASASGLLVNEL